MGHLAVWQAMMGATENWNFNEIIIQRHRNGYTTAREATQWRDFFQIVKCEADFYGEKGRARAQVLDKTLQAVLCHRNEARRTGIDEANPAPPLDD